MFLGDVTPQSMRMSTVFAGGLGSTRDELCGALSGGAMVIGALLGRVSVEENDEQALALTAEYRKRFVEAFGRTQCSELREKVVDVPGGLGSCARLVQEASEILAGLLEETV